jgi:hypothetical protein
MGAHEVYYAFGAKKGRAVRYVIPCVEQLDRATRELHEGNPVNSRLALILTDNVVELASHRTCKQLIDWDGGRSWLDKPKFSQQQRKRVLGRFFDQKIAFLRSEGLLAEDEQEFILIAHEHRNKAYHIGLRDDAIMWSLAWHYHKLGCELFGRLKPECMQSTSNDRYTHRVKYHLRKVSGGGRLGPFAEVDKLAESLAAERPVADRSLAAVLSESLLEELDELEFQVDFLVTDNPNQLDKSAILQHVQYYADFHAEMEKTKLFPSDRAYQREVKRIQKCMQTSWKPKYDRLPVDGWRRRAKSLASEKNYLNALKKFESVRAEKAYLTDAISDAAGQLDAHIQMEIDHARGK